MRRTQRITRTEKKINQQEQGKRWELIIYVWKWRTPQTTKDHKSKKKDEIKPKIIYMVCYFVSLFIFLLLNVHLLHLKKIIPTTIILEIFEKKRKKMCYFITWPCMWILGRSIKFRNTFKIWKLVNKKLPFEL